MVVAICVPIFTVGIATVINHMDMVLGLAMDMVVMEVVWYAVTVVTAVVALLVIVMLVWDR